MDKTGSLIRRRRLSVGLTLSKLAKEAGVGKGNLSEIENGKKSPTTKTVGKLAKALGLKPSSLVGTDD